MTVQTRGRAATSETRPAGTLMTALAWILAAGVLAFAVVNIVFETTGRFDEGPLEDYSSALSIANWLVAAIKVAGAAVALLSVTERPRLSPRLINFSIWGAAWVLVIYVLGSLIQALGIAIDGDGSGYQIETAGVIYVALFLVAAAGFCVLAVSHTRRSGLGMGLAILGSLAAVILLALILLILPAILSGIGLMPSP